MQSGFFLTKWFFLAMTWLYSNIGNVFLTILIATTVLRIFTVFSDIKTRKSSAAMNAIQPEIMKLQKKYASDPQKLQREQSKLMRERGVSMFSSCLPLLITTPLFFCFFAAFRHWGSEMTVRLLVEDNAQELFESFKFLWINNIWQPDNGFASVVPDAQAFLATKNLHDLIYLHNNTEAWTKLIEMGLATAQNIDGVTTYSFLTTDAAIAAFNTAMEPFAKMYEGYNNGWFIMPILAAGTNFLSVYITQKNQPKPQGDAAAAQGTGKLMTYLFPAMSFFFCLSYNASFAIYWTLSSIYMVIVNIILNKKFKIEPAKEVSGK